MRKKVLTVLFFVVYGLVWQYNELISYGYMQAKGQLEVIFNSVPVEDVLANSEIDHSIKDKIKLMQEIRRYAIDSIGLNNSDNYTSFYDQQDKNILWNLSACAPFEFKAKEWSFPILGSFSYKGFFDLKKAKNEKKILDSLGFDTKIRAVSAWSTLGWFDDPILSNMLKRSEGALAELIIHELTHSTIFIKDSLTFNENLASFIGQEGTLKFLESKFGLDSDEYKNYLNAELDNVKYTSHMLHGFKLLDSLYSTYLAITDDLKLRKKNELIQTIVDNIDTISFANKKRFITIFENQLPNNAYFQSYERYTSQQELFKEILNRDYNGSIIYYLEYLKTKWQ